MIVTFVFSFTYLTLEYLYLYSWSCLAFSMNSSFVIIFFCVILLVLQALLLVWSRRCRLLVLNAINPTERFFLFSLGGILFLFLVLSVSYFLKEFVCELCYW